MVLNDLPTFQNLDISHIILDVCFYLKNVETWEHLPFHSHVASIGWGRVEAAYLTGILLPSATSCYFPVVGIYCCIADHSKLHGEKHKYRL